GAIPALPDVPVDVVLLPRSDDAVLLDVAAPPRVPVATRFAVSVEVGRTTGGATDGRQAVAVTVSRGGARVGPIQRVSLRPGERARLRFVDRIDAPGLVRYRAAIAAGFGPPDGDRREVAVRVGIQPRVATIGNVDSSGWRGIDAAPERPDGVAARWRDPAVRRSFDAIVLTGPLSRDAQERVAAAVREGAGLVVLGGVQEGGPLAPLLPLTETPPEGRATLLVLDFSGSMERRRPELIAAVEELRRTLPRRDRVTYVAFSGSVVEAPPWMSNDGPRWDLARLRPAGQTVLAGALRRARERFAEIDRARRRMLVISDGAWQDAADAAEVLATMGGMERAALFVQSDVAPQASALFPRHFKTARGWTDALRELEAGGADRHVAAAAAKRAAAPAWLEGAVPPAGRYEHFVRLFPRNAQAAVSLFADDAALVGAARPGGKVVVCAPRIDSVALVRAVLRDTGGVSVSATRRGAMIGLTVTGPAAAPVTVAGEPVTLRRVAPQRREGEVPAPEGPVEVRCAGVVHVVPAAEAAEVVGLTPRSDIAKEIARRTGGRFHTAPPEGTAAAGPRPAVWIPLLCGALLVVYSGVRRRR
ncbi:MAG: VWA domain-containing protein, partial [Planctomycetota bacterium]|nr:VWA domain-containing protein [Planctomycetota bacterium]